MKVQTQLARLIDLTETKVRYDAQVKKVLANEAILVWILKTCVDEFSFCSLYEIAECIKGTPEISASAVHPVDPDAEETGEQINSDRQIESTGTEDGSLKEQTVFYDIRFHACVPGNVKPVRLIINIEAQQATALGYPIEKRSVYYCSRLISGQYGTVFSHSEYGKIRKVYSIWLCMDPAKKWENSIEKITLDGKVIYGDIDFPHINADLLQVMIINLGDPGVPVESPILRLMNVLLAAETGAEEKKQVLQEEFHIAMTAELESEVLELCNLSQGVYNKGMKAGFERGIDEGVKRGISQGISQGIS